MLAAGRAVGFHLDQDAGVLPGGDREVRLLVLLAVGADEAATRVVVADSEDRLHNLFRLVLQEAPPDLRLDGAPAPRLEPLDQHVAPVTGVPTASRIFSSAPSEANPCSRLSGSFR
jgi:hypothetical protein